MFESFDQIKKDYEFTSVDEKRIKELQPIMEKHLNEFLNRLYQFIFRLPQSNKFFKNE